MAGAKNINVQTKQSKQKSWGPNHKLFTIFQQYRVRCEKAEILMWKKMKVGGVCGGNGEMTTRRQLIRELGFGNWVLSTAAICLHYISYASSPFFYLVYLTHCFFFLFFFFLEHVLCCLNEFSFSNRQQIAVHESWRLWLQPRIPTIFHIVPTNVAVSVNLFFFFIFFYVREIIRISLCEFN